MTDSETPGKAAHVGRARAARLRKSRVIQEVSGDLALRRDAMRILRWILMVWLASLAIVLAVVVLVAYSPLGDSLLTSGIVVAGGSATARSIKRWRHRKR
jgi:hypothetical protein